MWASLAKNLLIAATLLLIIGALTWTADFRLALDGNDSTSMVLLADDWAIYGDLIWGESRTPETKIREIFLESWEARPLRALEYAALIASYSVFGIHGGFWLQMAILTISGALFAYLLRRRFPWSFALFGGALVVLHPADTTHLWLATMMAKLGVVYALLALCLFVHQKLKLAASLLVMSFLSYELAPLIFSLAPFLADSGSKKSVKDAIVVFGTSMLIYVAWRFLIFSEAAPDVRLLVGPSAPFDFLAYITVFGTTIRDLLFTTTITTPLMPTVQNLVLTLLASAVIAGLGLKVRRDRESSPTKTGKAACWGFIGILAGAAFSFRAAPNSDLGIASRHNLASIYGASLVFVTTAYGLSQIRWHKTAQFFSVLFAVLILSIFVQERTQVQRGYLAAGQFQSKRLRESMTAIGPVKPHTLIILEHPLDDWDPDGQVMAPFITGHAYEIEAICQLIFDKSILGFCRQGPEDSEAAKTTTAHAIFERNDEFYAIVHYDFATKKVTWVKKSQASIVEKAIHPHGPAWDYILGL